MQRFFWLLFLLALVFTSCVPNKRIVYLQHEKDPKMDAVPNTDSLYRKYNTSHKEYALRAGDIISLHIASLTPNEFDFVQKYMESLGVIRELNQYDQATTGQSNMRMGGGGTGGGGGNDQILGSPTMSAIMMDRLQTGFKIDLNGELELPKVGKLPLAGLSVAEAEKLIVSRLQGYFETPVVRVQLLSFHFTILGEVNKEGRFTIFNPNANIFDAITIAQNLTDFADRSRIKVIRFKGEVASVNYLNTLRENLLEQPGFFLQPNDLIIVPPLEARATRKYTLPNYTTGVSLIVSTLALLLLIVNISKP
jgi:polysaccharide biosynthesis/export protein